MYIKGISITIFGDILTFMLHVNLMFLFSFIIKMLNVGLWFISLIQYLIKRLHLPIRIGFDFSISWKDRMKTGFQEMKIKLILQWEGYNNFDLKTFTGAVQNFKC